MNLFFALFRNENMKLFAQEGTWAMLSIFSLAALSPLIIPIFVKLSWNGFLVILSGMFVLYNIFVLIVTAGIMANEFHWGTIKLLMIRPATRSLLLLSKYFSVLWFGWILQMILFVDSYASAAVFYGHDQHLTNNMFMFLLKLFSLETIKTLILVTIVFMISVLSQSKALSLMFGILLSISYPFLSQLLLGSTWVKYILFTHLDLKPFLFGVSHIEGMNFWGSTGVLAAYYILFVVVTWAVFHYRDITR